MSPTALVLGGGRGLGRALVRFLSGQNFSLVCVTNSQESRDSLLAEIPSPPSPLLVEAFDYCDRRLSESLLNRLELDGRREDFPVLAIYCAGYLFSRQRLVEEPVPEIDREIDVNFRAPLFWSTLLSRHFADRGRGGHLFISSGVASSPRPGWGAYGVAKGALEALSIQLSLDLPSPLFSLTINPGAMATRMRRIAYPEENPETIPSPEAAGKRIGRLCLELVHGQGREYNGKRLMIGDLA